MRLKNISGIGSVKRTEQMMIQTSSSLLILAAFLMAFSSTTRSTLPIDVDRSTITWHGSKVTGTHTGNLNVKHGMISAEAGVPVAAEVVVDMTSITCTDITSEGSNARLVAHLNSEDFFDTSTHGEAKFKATAFEAIPAAATHNLNYLVTGDLTIKGVTHPASFKCAFNAKQDGGYHAKGTLTFDRTKYDIQYRSGSFFEELGDKMIDDEVKLDLDLRTK